MLPFYKVEPDLYFAGNDYSIESPNVCIFIFSVPSDGTIPCFLKAV